MDNFYVHVNRTVRRLEGFIGNMVEGVHWWDSFPWPKYKRNKEISDESSCSLPRRYILLWNLKFITVFRQFCYWTLNWPILSRLHRHRPYCLVLYNRPKKETYAYTNVACCFLMNYRGSNNIHRVQSAGWLNSEFAVGNFLRKRCATCREKCWRAAGTAIAYHLLLSLRINQI
jgi:hypothetical protein